MDTVVLTHNHFDHTGGLVTLRRAMREKNPSALRETHEGAGIFLPRSLDPVALDKLPPIPPELLVSVLDARGRYQALVIVTSKGLVVVAGCGHAGIVNTLEYARSIGHGKPVHAVLGGFHLIGLPEEKVQWTGAKMRESGIQHIVGSHCTGVNTVQTLRDSAGLGLGNAVVDAVGSVFTLEGGIQPGVLNR